MAKKKQSKQSKPAVAVVLPFPAETEMDSEGRVAAPLRVNPAPAAQDPASIVMEAMGQTRSLGGPQSVGEQLDNSTNVLLRLLQALASGRELP